MALYPLDEKSIYKTLHDGIVSYAGELSPRQQAWLRNAINEAVQFPVTDVVSNRLFSDPFKVAGILIEEKQSLEIIIASLIYSRVKKELLSEDAYLKKLEDIALKYNADVQRMVRFALQEAYTDMPKVSRKLQQKFDASNEARKAHFAAIRQEKKINPGAKAKPQQTLEEKQTSIFVRYVDSRNPVPSSQAIRIADRWVLLQDIDPDHASDIDKARIKESWYVHAQMANNHGLRRFYYDFGNLYYRTFYPETYKAIEQSLEILANAVGKDGNPLNDVIDYLSTHLAGPSTGLERKFSLEDVEGGFYIKERLKKSVVSICTKLIGDGIDPEDFFKKHALQIGNDPTARLRILLQEVLKEVYDLFAFAVIMDEKPLIEKGLIVDEPHKPWHAHKHACVMGAEFLTMGCTQGLPLSRLGYSVLPARRKNYFEKPRGRRSYRSLHVGLSKKVSLPELGIDELDVPIEVIFRTPTVHFEAEYGKWAHNRFKSETIRGEAAWENAQTQVTARSKAYLFTPDGEILEFNKGTRIRDVAFEINQDLGLYCSGATAYRGHRSWRDTEHTELPELVCLSPDALIDDIDGCTIKIHANVPRAVKQLRRGKVIGYPMMPPKHSEESLNAMLENVTTDIAKRKINTILKRLGLQSKPWKPSSPR
ncbi:MAG: hypothetical protein SFW65_02530 [Alphaproteobacteria bacterium]|nr:hypothetical protein [Alphaproteobacteria bacterium]